jgi:molecular chaperone DnaJ
MGRELYLILGISESAPETQVRRAYQRLARRYHPDINPGDQGAEERYRRIAEAYQVLSDPDKRSFYDEHGYYSGDPREESDGIEAAAGADRRGASGNERFRRVFDEFLGRAEKTAPPNRDIEARVSLTFAESVKGVNTDVEVTRRRRCEECLGTGADPDVGEMYCPRCAGRGRVAAAGTHFGFLLTCPACSGRGSQRLACSRCSGRGTREKRERVRVDIPPGVSSGSRLRFPGRGHADPKTGERGDLFLVTQVAAHPFLRRVGDNLYCTVPITIPEAALGGKVPVPTLDGTTMLRIPPGVQPGQVLRLRGKGAPSLRADGARGDQYVEIRVVVPHVIDERSKEILRELARLHPEDPRKEPETHAR